MKTAISYIRFSTKTQILGDSARRQLEEFHRWCKANDLQPDLSASFADEGLSAFKGAHLKKNGTLGVFRDAVIAGKFPNHVLVAENLDRISRQGPKIARKLIEQIVDNGVDIHIITGNLKLTPGWENDTPRSVVVDVLLKQAWDYSQNLQRREKAVWGAKQAAATNGSTLTSRIPAWLVTPKVVKGVGGPIIAHADRAVTVKRIFHLASEGFGCKNIVKALNAEKRPCFGLSAKWTPEYVRCILANRAVLGEFQRHTIDGNGVRIPLGEVIQDYYPRIITPTEWKAARINVDAKNRNLNKNGKPAGGRQTVNSLLSPLVFDANNGLPMRYHKKPDEKPFMVTAWKDGVKGHRIDCVRLETAFLSLLEDLDWKSVAGRSELPEVKEQQAKLDIVLTELHKMERVVAKFEALVNDPDLDTKFVLGKLQEATEKVATLSAQRDSLESSIKSSRASVEALYSPEELLNAIRSGNPELRSKLKAEIAKRVRRISIEFRDRTPIRATIELVNGFCDFILFQP
jgi:DNA invertase Pin-like site-specific DNA recombinase